MQLSEIKNIFHKELLALYPKEEVDSFFYHSIEHFLQLERFILVMQPEYTLTKEEEEPLFNTLARLKQQEPIQHILGETNFMGLTIKVNRHTLIPRPETEELVQWILEMKEQSTETPKNDKLRILDIGTGSGCIAISLAKNLPSAEVYALDISEEALKVAHQNGELNEVKVNFIKGDILNPSEGFFDFPKFDIIVSNPPYVRELEKEEIHDNVKQYEPHTALFVPDNDSLVFYKAIANFSKEYLKDKGCLYLEINQYLGHETAVLFKSHDFGKVELKKDIFENHRMLRCIKQEK